MTRWAVFGASGFVGSAVVANLRAAGIGVEPISTPRLLTSARTLDGLREDLDRSSSEISTVVSRLADCRVVINAAGLAAPDRGPSDDLFGANALLPAVIGRAISQSGIERYVHVSSQAVQGFVPILTEDESVQPFSPYSLSKALGEQLLSADGAVPGTTVVLRAVSVHGRARATTQRLVAFAHSRYASVVMDVPAPLSLIENTAAAVVFCGAYPNADIPRVVLQPGDGLTVREALLALGAKRVRTLPPWAGRALVNTGRAIGRGSPRLLGTIRRAELLWFGQPYDARWLKQNGFTPPVGTSEWCRLNDSSGPLVAEAPCE